MTRGIPNQLFSERSPWRQKDARAADVARGSAAQVAAVVPADAVYANLYEFAIPLYAAGDAPTYSVGCRVYTWGPCPFSGVRIPIPDKARPHTGSDGALVVVDRAAGRSYEFWQAAKWGSTWTASWGAINSITGRGWGGAATGSGASRLGGVVRTHEVASGRIRHALAFQSSNVCRGVFVRPALKTDGDSTRSDCLPMGSRLRLAPGVRLKALDLTPGERAVAKALKRYGGFVMDKGGAGLSISFELERDSTSGNLGTVYRAAGFTGDYDSLRNVPWSRLQVLE
ncbi:hypothetical protein [Nocardioides sp. YIM 152588]|uniref:hypothetical protein n=1 Tax=Nocardioides sp. YIM 152588 TaxID=3158259 RepID=UPI0032E40C49